MEISDSSPIHTASFHGCINGELTRRLDGALRLEFGTPHRRENFTIVDFKTLSRPAEVVDQQ